MKKILGLDLGTNSIGWALIEQDAEQNKGRILGMGSRIVPMDGAEMSNFKKGQPQTRNAIKREKKGIRIGNKRYKQRRNKLLYVLDTLGMMPEQIKLSVPFDNPLRIDKVNILPIAKHEKQLTALELFKLKVKSIHEPVEPKEFGRILYKFNQLRGYAGGDEEDSQDEINEVLGIKSDVAFPSQINRVEMFNIICVKQTGEKKKGKKVFEIQVENIEKEVFKGDTLVESLNAGMSIELKQVIRQNKKTGQITSIEFSIPNKSGWRKKMENIENALTKHSEEYGRKTYISEYLLDCLKESRWTKIRDNVILRSRFQEEFDAVWEQQFKTHIESVESKTIEEIACFLFPGKSESQKQLRKEATDKGLYHIIRNQIIFYQRPLKDQSHLIAACRFEKEEKAVAKSHPLFQEYKIWEQINKLSIRKRIQTGVRKNGKPKYEYQDRVISSSFKEYLFEQLQTKREISWSAVFKEVKKRENFVEGEDFFNGLNTKAKLKGNDTASELKTKLGRFWSLLEANVVENQIEIWDLLFNGKGNEYDIGSQRNKAIAKYLKQKGIQEENIDKVIVAISKIKFPRNYASVSLKAIQKSLPLVRAGKYYVLSSFPKELNERISRLYNEIVEDPFEKSVQEYLISNNSTILENGGFVNAYALMLLYGNHTSIEVEEKAMLKSPVDVKPLERHSLRNPIVEQMINETLMVVKEIWQKYGKPDEIKVELARELKSNIKERARANESNREAEETNKRIKQKLAELKQELSGGNIEKYKLWERQVNKDPDYIEKYEATTSEIERMKLWEEQGHLDPYTRKPIPISQLFNKGLYDLDHIIPQSRYFDDSLANKVVCATAINRDKGNRTAMEYFTAGSQKHGNALLSKEDFIEHAVKNFYGKKRDMLLATKIPEDPVERQKKNTQYISVRIKEELAKIVGNCNVKTTTGGVTHYLRNHWGVTGIFKSLLVNRFEEFIPKKARLEYDKLKDKYRRVEEAYKEEYLNAVDKSVDFLESVPDQTAFEKDTILELINSFLPDYKRKKQIEKLENIRFPIDFDDYSEIYTACNYFRDKNRNLILKGYSKRLDHRHHAMDAFVVACTDEKAEKRLNDLNKHLQEWIETKSKDLKLDPDSDETYLEQFMDKESSVRNNAMTEIKRFRDIVRPWSGFENDLEQALKQIIVSYKPKDKILIQNKEEKDGQNKLIKTNEKIIRIRGALHEETVYGLSSEFESYRIPLSKFASANFDTKGSIEKIVNKFLRTVIREHFEKDFNKKKSDAFSAEGLLALNKKLKERTVEKKGEEEKRPHPPISSVKIYRKKVANRNKYEISLQKLDRIKSFNTSQYVNTGSNYAFAVLEKDGERIFDIISLFDAVQLIKDAFKEEVDKDSFDKNKVLKEYFEQKRNARLLFTLKQQDIVYFPEDDENVVFDSFDSEFEGYWRSAERSNNFFVVNKFSGKQIYFLPHTVADIIEKKIELGSQDKLEFFKGRKIANDCVPVSLDRLGNVVGVER